MKAFYLKLSTTLVLLFFSVTIANAQRPLDLGDRAMSSGKYEEALKYYREAYEISNDDAITKKINLAQTLKNEFDAVNTAIKTGRYEEAEPHFNNILIVDPDNIYVQRKKEEIKQAIADQKKRKNHNTFYRLTRGFRGSYPKHDEMGGLHFELGGAFANYTPVGNGLDRALRARLYYSNFKHFPFTIDVNMTALGKYQSMGAGIGSSYTIGNNFALNYGVGWQRNWFSNADAVIVRNTTSFYYSLGATYMFDNQNLGGISYSYNHTFGKTNYPVASHNISYVFGKGLSAYVGLLALIVGVSTGLSLLK